MKKHKLAPVVELTLTGIEAICVSEGLDELTPTGDIVISIDGVAIIGAISTIH